jgi:surface protein
MQGMFAEAESFNQSINNWDVGNVRSMQAMFDGAKSFNQDISSWDTSKVVYKIGDGIKSFNNITTPEINIENNSICEVNWLEINQPIYIDSGDDNLQMNTLYYDELNQEVFSVVSSNKAAKEIIDSIFDTIGGDFIKLNKNELDKLSSPIKSCIEAYQGNSIRLEIAKTLLSIQLIISKCDNKEVLKTYDENSFLNSDTQFSESIKFNNTTLREAIDKWLEDKDKAIEQFGNISKWDTSEVTDMSKLFRNANAFNDNIVDWNVSKVNNMSYMFDRAHSFNQNLGNWDVSNVTDMSGMFRSSKSFNHDISNWNVINVSNMGGMFYNAKFFNHDISNWDVSNVRDMSGMFYGAELFNQKINNWNVCNVTNMGFMFCLAISFNMDISQWNVSRVTNMNHMFCGSKSFNQNLGRWDVNNVADMEDMFRHATSFNQDLSNWLVGSETKVKGMFTFAKSFNKAWLPKKAK